MSKLRVYLDNCTYNRPFDDQSQIKVYLESEAKKYIQRLIVKNKIDLVYSFINRFEIDKSPYLENRDSISRFFGNALLYIDHTSAAMIEKWSVGIMKAGIKAIDAYHIAAAIEGGCGYFITTDRMVLKYSANEITICDPIQFLDYYKESENE